jgi:hypothetical protein
MLKLIIFGTISTFEGMKWKEQSFKNLLKQWNIYIYIKKMWVKIMINIFNPRWLALIKGGGKKCKTEMIYLQKYTNY